MPVFHVVRHCYNDVTTTYSIYANNEPYLMPAKGRKLSRREARWIADLLNERLDGPAIMSPREIAELAA